MSNDLFHLVYYSKNRISSNADIQTEIEAILRTSQRNNSHAELTGALIFNNGLFAQVLEGRQADIERTFERIQRDALHGIVALMTVASISLRLSWPSSILRKGCERELSDGEG